MAKFFYQFLGELERVIIPNLLSACNNIYTIADILLFEVEIVRRYIVFLPILLTPVDMQQLIFSKPQIDNDAKTQICGFMNNLTIAYYSNQCSLQGVVGFSLVSMIITLELNNIQKLIDPLLEYIWKTESSLILYFSLNFWNLRKCVLKEMTLMNNYQDVSRYLSLPEEYFNNLFLSKLHCNEKCNSQPESKKRKIGQKYSSIKNGKMRRTWKMSEGLD